MAHAAGSSSWLAAARSPTTDKAAAPQATSATAPKLGRSGGGEYRDVQSVLHLQRTTGNYAVTRSLRRATENVGGGRAPVVSDARITTQPKGKVHGPKDRYEQEADRIAKEVLRHQMPEARREKVEIQARTPQQAVGGTDERIEERLSRSKGGGSPLSAEARAFVEPLQFDLTEVRVHTDNEAARLNSELNARAFTFEKDIFFGSGKYDVHSNEGKYLLVHELAHVVQQAGSPGTVQCQREDSERPDRITTADSRAYVEEAIRALDAAGEHYETIGRIQAFDRAAGRRSTAGARVREVLTQILDWQKGAVEAAIRLIDDQLAGEQALRDRLRTAYLRAVRGVAAVAAGPRGVTPTFLRGHLDHLHEWAWPQSRAAVGAGSTLAAERAATRQAVQISTRPSRLPPDLSDLFATTGTRTSLGLPPGTLVEFASGVATGLRHGLRNVGAHLTTQTAPPVLDANTTTTVVLDLTPFGGELSAWRFTFLESGPARSRDRRLLIEPVGTVGVDRTPPSVLDQGRARMAQYNIRREGAWESGEWDDVLAALAIVPEAQLQRIAGVRFARASAAASEVQLPIAQRQIGGDYDMEHHRIRLYDTAWTGRGIRGVAPEVRRFGVPGTGAGMVGSATRAVVHEIGHALDRAPVREAWADYERSRGTTADERGLTATRGLSGVGYHNVRGTFELGMGPDRGVSFRRAVTRDGTVRITDYAATDWEETFAESYSFYLTDPELMERLRPHTFSWFDDNLPR